MLIMHILIINVTVTVKNLKRVLANRGCLKVVELPGLFYLHSPNSFIKNLCNCISTVSFLLHIKALRRCRNGWGKKMEMDLPILALLTQS